MGQMPHSADGIPGGERQKVACLGAHQLSGEISNKLPTICPKHNINQNRQAPNRVNRGWGMLESRKQRCALQPTAGV